MGHSKFIIGDIVERIGYDGLWTISSIMQQGKIVLIGVEGQWRGWPIWPETEFRLALSSPTFLLQG